VSTGGRPAAETVPAEPVATADAGVANAVRVMKRVLVDVVFTVVVVVKLACATVSFKNAGSVGRSGFVKISGLVAFGARVLRGSIDTGAKVPVKKGFEKFVAGRRIEAEACTLSVVVSLLGVGVGSGSGQYEITISVWEGNRKSTVSVGILVTLSVRCSPLGTTGKIDIMPAGVELAAVVAERKADGMVLIDGIEITSREMEETMASVVVVVFTVNGGKEIDGIVVTWLVAGLSIGKGVEDVMGGSVTNTVTTLVLTPDAPPPPVLEVLKKPCRNSPM
jgi:hypothetical protein